MRKEQTHTGITPLAKGAFFCLSLAGILMSGFGAAWADEFVFSNGEKVYGTMRGFRGGAFVVDIDGKEQTYPISQVKEFNPGVTGPTPKEMLESRMEPESSEAGIQNASGAFTEAKGYRFKEFGFEVETEMGFSLTVLQIQRDISGFYGRTGVRIAGMLRNDSGFAYRGVDFRIYFLNGDGGTLASQEFYIFRFPPGATRSFAVRVPGLQIERIQHLKIVRRF